MNGLKPGALAALNWPGLGITEGSSQRPANLRKMTTRLVRIPRALNNWILLSELPQHSSEKAFLDLYNSKISVLIYKFYAYNTENHELDNERQKV